MKKKIILTKHFNDYRRFRFSIQLEKELSPENAIKISNNIIEELNKKTKTKWQLRTLGGNVATFSTPIINNREKRRRLKGKEVEIEIGQKIN